MSPAQRELLDRANRAAYVGLDEEAARLMRALAKSTDNPEPFAVGGPVLTQPPGPLARARAALSRAWHRLTCRQTTCLELFGRFQHPAPNRRALRP